MGKRQAEFRSTARFEVRGRLGAGGMGIVHRVLDRERGTEVALKTLAHVSASAIFRFKQEFRALADVSHPNLVTLHELFYEDDSWFFTMELVDGIDLLTHICGNELAPPKAETEVHTVVDKLASTPRRPRSRDADDDHVFDARPRGRPLLGRLREVLPQLVGGVKALHDAGYLHHDIKPSNILVTPQGRVVLLDFGVAARVGSQATEESAGTPPYMAPEQAMGAAATPASDWYSVGIVLYQLLAGQLPFTGTPEGMLWAKMREPPQSPHQLRDGLPDDLVTLALALLHAEAAQRPSGTEILARVGAATPQRREVTADPTLIGRDRHLAVLRDAFARSRRGGAAIFAHGLSGMGKSALVRAFLEEVARDPQAVVLAGRCYERESVPYKTLDAIVDALCQHLVALPEDELAALVPPDAELLPTLFPVLRRIEAFVGDVDPELARRPGRLRRRAFVALRRLLAAIGARRPLVVFVDDLQWGDSDSAPLLDALVRPPDAPAMLLLGCYRSDEESRSDLLRALSGAIPRLAVDALAPEDAARLAAALCRSEGAPATAAHAIALESGGNPFFLQELVRAVAASPAIAMPSLDDIIRVRVDSFGAQAHKLIDILAVAGRPLPLHVARAAAEVDETEWQQLVQLVQTSRLARVSGRRSDDLIECYHDRIRETVVAALPADQQARIHNALAAALQTFQHRDPETIARHFEEAGDLALAVHFTLQAADVAASALAFDRAAALYRRALELQPPGAATFDALAVRMRLAAALAHAGRGAEAAEIYLEAAAAVDGATVALELRRLAAEQLLRSGRVDQGLVVLGDVLRGAGMALPRTTLRSIPSLLWWRLRLRLRGLEPSPASNARAAQLDVCRTAALGLALFDPVRSAAFSTRHVALALDSGDAHRIAFALSLEAGYMASARDPVRAKQLLARAEETAAPLAQALLQGTIGVIRTIMAYERGDFREAFEVSERTEELLRDNFTGMAWELRTLQMFSIHSLFFLGDFKELRRRAALRIAEAAEQGDLYAIMNFRSLAGACIRAVGDDDPDGATAMIGDVEAQLPASGFYLQHMFLLFARTVVDLYTAEPARAYERLRDMHPQVRGSLLLEDRSVKLFWSFLRAGAALGTAVQHPAHAPRLLRVAKRAARTLERDGALPYVAMAQLVRGASACVRGDVDTARAQLAAASASFESAGMRMFAMCALRRLAQVNGSAEQLAAADAVLIAEGIPVPAKAARCLAPGFPEAQLALATS